MAVFKQLNGRGRYHDDLARHDVINYILRLDKAMSGFIGGIHVDPFSPAESMRKVAQKFENDSMIRLRHFIISFSPDEIDDPEVVNEIAQKITLWIGQRFQAVYAVHEDVFHLHAHFVFNSVSFLDGRKFYGTRKDLYDFINFLKSLLLSYGVTQLHQISWKSGQDTQDFWE